MDYIVPSLEGVTLVQKNVNIYITNVWVWIDVHCSKVQFTKKDQPPFDKIVKGLKFEKPADGK